MWFISARQGASPKMGLLRPRSGHDACGRVRVRSLYAKPIAPEVSDSPNRSYQRHLPVIEFGYICDWER